MGEQIQQRGQRVADAVDRVACELAARGVLSAQSHRRIVELLDRFGRFVEVGHGVACLDEVTPEHARAFVSAFAADGAAPGLATQYLRRSAIRLALGGAATLGLGAAAASVWDEAVEKRVAVVAPGRLLRGAWQRPWPCPRVLGERGYGAVLDQFTFPPAARTRSPRRCD